MKVSTVNEPTYVCRYILSARIRDLRNNLGVVFIELHRKLVYPRNVGTLDVHVDLLELEAFSYYVGWYVWM